MAIFNFTVQRISRGDGRGAVAAASYRHRERMREEETGRTCRYTNHRDEKVHAELALPDQTPEWLRNLVDGRAPAQASEALWNRVEREATRANAVLAREINMALPKELSRKEHIALMRDFVREAFTSRGVVADWVIHEKPGNPHAHVMLTAQPLSETGFGKSYSRILDAAGEPVRANGKVQYKVWEDGRDTIRDWRRAWENVTNRHLERAGIEARIDGRSLNERGSSLTPNVHLGPENRSDRNGRIEGSLERRQAAIQRENAERIRANPSELVRLAASQAAVFTRRDVERVANRYLKGAEPEEVRTLVDEALASPDIAATLSSALDPFTGRMVEAMVYATRDMIALEQRMMEQARALRLDPSHGVDSAHVEAALNAQDDTIRTATDGRAALSEEQREAVRYVTDARGIAAVVGFAGSGKSTMLQAAKEAWIASGRRVFGAALAGKAAEGLKDSSGIESRTLASWEYAWSQGRDALQKGDVFVIDEAGMVSSGQLARVIDTIHTAGAKAVLVGDAMQLQPIQAGAAFRAISERIGFVELEGIRRQRAHEWQREASLDLARGRTFEALQAYRSHGSVRFHDTAEAAREQIVADWSVANRQGSVLVVAHANKDVDALNCGIRDARKAGGELSGTEVHFETSRGLKGFAIGDRVLFLKNEAEVKNGMLGTVEGLGLDTLTVRTDGGNTVTLKPSEYEHFSHGYAATVHKAQGATVDRTLVYASETMDRHLAYVAMTRHRDDAVIYASSETFGSLADLAQKLGRDGAATTTLDHDFMRRRANVNDLPEAVPDRALTRDVSAQRPRAETKINERAPAAGDAAAILQAALATADQVPRQTGTAPTAEVDAGAIVDKAAAVTVHARTEPATHSERAAKVMVAAVRSAPGTDKAAIEARVAAAAAFHRAREAARFAVEAVWKNSDPIVARIDAAIRGEADMAALAALMRERPEQLGEMHGREERRGLLARLLPESEVARAGRTERAAAQEDAGFAADQAMRASSIWRDRLAQETAAAVVRTERMGHAVPYLSDRASGLLRAFVEAREAGPEAERLAGARARDREDLTAELVAYDAALTRRFGADAFTERATERFEDALGRDRWAAGMLRTLGPKVRDFAAAQREMDARLARAAQDRATRPGPLFAAVTSFDRTPEEVARDRVMADGSISAEVKALEAAARVVYRNPDAAVRAIVEALPDREGYDRFVDHLFERPEEIGALAGAKGMFVGRAEKQARAAAEETAKDFALRARELGDNYAGAVRLAAEQEREARAAAAIEVPGLSAAAQAVVDRLQGLASDQVGEQYRALSASPEVRREVEAFGEAVLRKFGLSLKVERVSPRPTAEQRAQFARELPRLEAARALARGQRLERDRQRELVRDLQQRNERGR
ncbi:Ti-type conjugative transfer relaxase TraA [Methylobacterium isbiliense]|nr:Ti-type conjugative transfer relaxase TraA [Methylobacterium isbiliense]MDN3627674.1 Ti-type conjugative transfer relaxase TraA [Methylobacterium isbiliense]